RNEEQNWQTDEECKRGRQAPFPLSVRAVNPEAGAYERHPTNEDRSDPTHEPPQAGEVLDATRSRRNLKETEDEIAGRPGSEERGLHVLSPPVLGPHGHGARRNDLEPSSLNDC